MSVREISSQSKYALIAYENITAKSTRGNKAVFSSIHSFLTHTGLISKLLWSDELKDARGKTLAEVLSVPSVVQIKNRKYRNILEYYDEYLKEWINSKGNSSSIMDNNIGPKGAIQLTNGIWVRHYDPSTNVYSLIDNDLGLTNLHEEVMDIKQKSIDWLNPELSWDDLDDEEKQEFDEDALLEELSEEFESDPDSALERAADLGYGIDDLNV
jgi:hypothetical protein